MRLPSGRPVYYLENPVAIAGISDPVLALKTIDGLMDDRDSRSG